MNQPSHDPIETGHLILVTATGPACFRLLRHLHASDPVSFEIAKAIIGGDQGNAMLSILMLGITKVFDCENDSKVVSIGDKGRAIIELAAKLGELPRKPETPDWDAALSSRFRG